MRPGSTRFGENYVQEALAKIDAAGRPARALLEWHLIGPLQSNKTRAVAEHFDWVHSVDRLKLAERLSAQRPPQLGRRCRSACRSTSAARQARAASRPPRCPRWRAPVARCPGCACAG